MQEQRVTVRLIQYWELIRKDRPFPDIAQFNPSMIEDLWPHCLRVNVNGQAHPTYKYEYMGEPVAVLYGGDLTGMVVDHRVMEFPGSVIHKKLDSVVRDKAVLKDEGHLISKQGKLVKYRACFLPFGNEKEGITHVIVSLTSRMF